MWLLVLLLSIKLNMPTWYFVLFTVYTIFMPFIALIKYITLTQIYKKNIDK